MADHSLPQVSGGQELTEPLQTHPDSCALCGLSLRHGMMTSTYAGKGLAFCCRGCHQVFTILAAATDTEDYVSFRTTDLFRRCQEMGIIPSSESNLPDQLPEDAQHSSVKRDRSASAPKELATAPSDGSLLRLHLKVAGMWCPACAWVIEEVLKKLPGIRNAACNFSTDRLWCEYDPRLTSPTNIISSIQNVGYKAFVPDDTSAAKARKAEFIRLVISAFLTMNVMMLSFSLYSGFLTELGGESILNLSLPLFVLASIVVFYGGKTIHEKAWAGFSSARYSMETLISLGALTTYFYSTFNFSRGSMHLYYDTASMLITLTLLGKMLEGRSKERIQQDLNYFYSLKSTKVNLCSERYPEGRYVAAEILRSHDTFRVAEGETVGADGVAVEGSGEVDESSLTGEPRPVHKKPGDAIRSGSRMITGSLKVRTERVGEDSTLGQIIGVMEKAIARKAPGEFATERILRWFVPSIVVFALGTGAVCALRGVSLEDSLVRAVTVMVISCPCALGIAIPLARLAGVSGAARRGIIVRDFSSFERAGKIHTLVFDKTGTLTKGEWQLHEVVPVGGTSEGEVLALASALEKDSGHYLAREIQRRAAEKQVAPGKVDTIIHQENGITGNLGKDQIKIGSRAFLAKEIQGSLHFPAIAEAHEHREVESTVYLSRNGRLCALFIFGDALREDSESTVRELRARGYGVSLVSGDGEKTTHEVARMVGISEALGEKLPQDKAAVIEELQRAGNRVAMVGDGINDAPALAQSDLAIALSTGNNLGREAADIMLMRGELHQVLDFLHLARRVTTVVKVNLGASAIYNLISIPVAVTGLLTPVIAVTAMVLSSLSVTVSTLMFTRGLSREPLSRGAAP